jgi:hypothetical protein
VAKNKETAQAQLEAAESRDASLGPEIAEIKRQIGALDPLSADSDQQRTVLRERLGTLEDIRAHLPKKIEELRAAAASEKDAERQDRLAALRPGITSAAAEFFALSEKTLQAGDVLTARVRDCLVLGGFPHIPDISPALVSLRATHAVCKVVSPELLHLPARPSREQEIRANAVADCQSAIDLWEWADHEAKNGNNHEVKRIFRQRADELQRHVELCQERCREVGAEPPTGGQSFLTALFKKASIEVGNRLETEKISSRYADAVAEALEPTEGEAGEVDENPFA